MDLIFIAGVPGSGKTSFGNWLATNRDFYHLDMEADGFAAIQPLHALWDRGVRGESLSPFVAGLRVKGPKVVATWGFPPSLIHLPWSLKGLGMTCWWFESPPAIALRNWKTARPSANDSVFHNQMSNIEANAGSIRALFTPNILPVTQPDGSFLPVAAIAAKIGVE